MMNVDNVSNRPCPYLYMSGNNSPESKMSPSAVLAFACVSHLSLER